MFSPNSLHLYLLVSPFTCKQT